MTRQLVGNSMDVHTVEAIVSAICQALHFMEEDPTATYAAASHSVDIDNAINMGAAAIHIDCDIGSLDDDDNVVYGGGGQSRVRMMRIRNRKIIAHQPERHRAMHQ